MTDVKAVDYRNIIMCNKCLDVIESVHVHDYNSCECGAISIDGGPEYQRVRGNAEDMFCVDSPFHGPYDSVRDLRISTKYKNGEFVTTVQRGFMSGKNLFMDITKTEENALALHETHIELAEAGLYDDD